VISINFRYATSLRPLRPYCQILHIRPAQPSSLLPRLQKICHLENIKADARALTLLADSHEGDLRSCLNSLQLLSTRCDNLTLSFVQEALLKSKKEGTLTSHTVVEGVFSKRTAKEKRRLNLTEQIEGQRVVNDFLACGETDRIMSGILPPPTNPEAVN
jgi:chromosome transmission fidelity protein 18